MKALLTPTGTHLCVHIDEAANCIPESGAVSLCSRCSCVGEVRGRGSLCCQRGVGLTLDDAIVPLVDQRLPSRHVPLP